MIASQIIPPTAAAGPVPARPHQILVVDDEVKVRALVERALANTGYCVATATNGRKALELVSRLQPTLVITDLHMPDEDGITVIREVRRQHPAIRLIAISGGGRYGDRLLGSCLEMASYLGADAVLRKPFDVDELIALVAATLDPAPQPAAPGTPPGFEARG